MADLDMYLRDRRDWVDQALAARLPPAEARPATLHAAMRYSLFPGGKRLRPVLCLAAAETVRPTLSDVAREDALRAALALEVLHTYTLIHDDLPCMDDDVLRRGRPTVHVVYGEANAVLAGDALQALAFAWLAGASSAVASALVLELALAAGSEGVVGGQVEDIAASAPGTTVDAATVAYIHRHKTGDLFRASLRMGGLAAGATLPQLAALTAYGDAIGEAFQITDDLLDAAPAAPDSAGAPAKPPPLSCLSVMTPEAARERVRALLAEATEALQVFPPPSRHMLEALAARIENRKS